MTDQERLIKLETKVEQLENQIIVIFNDIREIKDKLLGRPSWGVSIVITVLTTTCVALITFVLKH